MTLWLELTIVFEPPLAQTRNSDNINPHKVKKMLLLGGGNSNIFGIFTPIYLGKMFTHFDVSHIFQVGEVGTQPPTRRPPVKLPVSRCQSSRGFWQLADSQGPVVAGSCCLLHQKEALNAHIPNRIHGTA